MWKGSSYLCMSDEWNNNALSLLHILVEGFMWIWLDAHAFWAQESIDREVKDKRLYV